MIEIRKGGPLWRNLSCMAFKWEPGASKGLGTVSTKNIRHAERILSIKQIPRLSPPPPHTHTHTHPVLNRQYQDG